MYVSRILNEFSSRRARPSPANAGKSNGPDTSFMKPFSPSKIGDGPLMPCWARTAANTPFRAAFEKAQAFHMERAPTRVCRSATLATPARLTAWTVWVCDSFSTLAAASADEKGPYVTWYQTRDQ